MTQRVWVLGASDPEMEMIEDLLRKCGEPVVYATGEDGRRVHPGNAYRCPIPSVPEGATVYAVECLDTLPEGWVRVDHHRPGDPGYGRPPAEFLPASSLGQVLSELARLKVPLRDRLGPYPYQGEYRTTGAGLISPPNFTDEDEWSHHWTIEAWDGHRGVSTFTIPEPILCAAAADHCLGAAYRGECPEVHPDALMRWRTASRAQFQRRSVDDVLADVEAARAALRAAATVELAGVPVADLRGRSIPELPEAAAREGMAFLAVVKDRDGRRKVVLGGAATPEVVKAFMESWAPAKGLADIYGDPARGFAGGYLPAE